MSPLFDIAPFTVNGTREGNELSLWAANPDGASANPTAPYHDLTVDAVCVIRG